MLKKYLHDPRHFLCRLAHLSPYKHWVGLSLFCLLVSSYPIYQNITLWQKLEQTQLQHHQLTQQYQQQSRLIQSLQQQQYTGLTEQQTQQVSHAHLQIQHLLAEIPHLTLIEQQWHWGRIPKITLTLEGSFLSFYSFMQQLAYQTDFYFYHLYIEKFSEESPLSLHFQLQIHYAPQP